MFRALLAHRQEALHKRHLVYCVRAMSVSCTSVKVERSCFHYNDYDKISGFINAQHFFFILDIVSFSRGAVLNEISPNGASHRLCIAGYNTSLILQLCTSSYRPRNRREVNIFYLNFSFMLNGSGRAGLWVGRAGPLPRALTSRGRRKGSHRPATL
jgi:hypothetical protein